MSQINLDDVMPAGAFLEIYSSASYGTFRVIVPFSPLQLLDDENKKMTIDKGYSKTRPNDYVAKLIDQGYIEKVHTHTLYLDYNSLYMSMRVYEHDRRTAHQAYPPPG